MGRKQSEETPEQRHHREARQDESALREIEQRSKEGIDGACPTADLNQYQRGALRRLEAAGKIRFVDGGWVLSGGQ